MLYYFDAPNRPSKRLMRIKQAVDRWLAGENDDGTRFSLWVCAWLDLMVRDDAQGGRADGRGRLAQRLPAA